MGDRATLAKARKELEDMYSGVPDDSVNLTFQDFAQVRPIKKPSPPSPSLELAHQSAPKQPETSSSGPSVPLSKLPSLDFSRGLQASNNHHIYNQEGHVVTSPRSFQHHQPDLSPVLSPRVPAYVHNHHVNTHTTHNQHHNQHNNQYHNQHHNQYNNQHHAGSTLHSMEHNAGFRHADQRSIAFDDMSYVSGMSVAYGLERGAARRRPGVPHSKICTVCCNYVYIFRHRCLVCGRAYCRQCVRIGMGEMTEGRKCLECLGRRFSQRYIQRAGNVGCCMGYPSTVKQQELKWAEKGPRKSGENQYGQSMMVSRSRSPIRRPATPTSLSPSNPPSFVMSSAYSPYSPSKHHMPF